MFLLDSNIIIYAVKPGFDAVRKFIAANSVIVSWVSYVEVLGYTKLNAADRKDFEQFFALAHKLPLSEPVLQKAAELKQIRKISLGDALIASSAITAQAVLATSNGDDFKWIKGLQIVDPTKP